MKAANPRVLTINGGSSSIKFALFEAGDALRRIRWHRRECARGPGPDL
jgi:acetate kinase